MEAERRYRLAVVKLRNKRVERVCLVSLKTPSSHRKACIIKSKFTNDCSDRHILVVEDGQLTLFWN